ncbi:hypothetical protein LSCM1_02718 [Leishmania martiniquensis]|uniref:Phosphoglycerate mutase n=1 Tax=Leishmania martiniquensis TaxID=1580590 RepID=A0A836H253_9TRYP|nr:hypothetical protein LSCM1_02718 [Leishmania martiniquensis]
MEATTHAALASRALQHVLTAAARAPRVPSGASMGRCHSTPRTARLVRVGVAGPLMPIALTDAYRCASSSGFSRGSTPPSPPVPPSSAVPPHPSTPGWVSVRKPNGEQRMSISIRSTSQRQLARRQSLAASSISTHVPQAEFVPVGHLATAANAPSGRSPLSPAPEKQAAAPTTMVASACPLSAAAQPPFAASRDQRNNQSRESIRGTASPMPTPPPSTSSASSRVAVSKPTTPSALSSAFEAPRTDRGPERERSHRAVASTISSPAARASVTAGSQGTGASHPLLYSVSRFTEPVKRIILIRNGRSEANEDVSAYVQTPDWRIPLVEEGKREAVAAGRALSELIGDDPVYFYYSPYMRSRQSLRYVLQGFDEARLCGPSYSQEWWEEEEIAGATSAATTAESVLPSCATAPAGEASASPLLEVCLSPTSADVTSLNPQCCFQRDPSLVLNSGTSNNIIGVREDVRLRDGDIGRYTSADELRQHLVERERYGRFFYRFPFGESGADVCDRVTSFLDAFQRERVEFPMDTNVVIITHGLTMRMFIKRWFYLTVDTFHKMKSPPPGSLCTLTRLHHRSCFRLDECCVESMNLPLSLNEFNGYKYRNKQLLGSMSSGAPYM